MARILASSADERIRSCRRDLVLDLATRYGWFWLTIDSLRRKWRIDAPRTLPPELPRAHVDLHSNPAYRPVPWPDRILQSVPVHPEGTLNTVEFRPGPAMASEAWAAWCEEEWWRDLKRLHELFVPAPCTRVGPAAKLLWAPFLSACLLYDPPGWGLLRFADIPTLVFDLPARVAPTEVASNDILRSATPAPVVFLQDPQWAKAAIDALWFETTDLVADELDGLGVDFRAMLRSVVNRHPAVVERALSRDGANPSLPYVAVTGETTDADARRAARLLKAGTATRDRGERREDLSMLGAPIAFLQDPARKAADADTYWHEVFDLLADELLQRGVDLRARVRDVLDKHPEVLERVRAREAANPVRPHIAVTTETSDAEVRAAVRQIKGSLSWALQRGGRPRRDPLVSFHCAVWRDAYQIKTQEIARMMGWTVSEDDYGTPRRSETVREHIVEGRRIREERADPVG